MYPSEWNDRERGMKGSQAAIEGKGSQDGQRSGPNYELGGKDYSVKVVK